MKPRSDGVIPPHQPNCFGCGPQNAAGLAMTMRVQGDRVLGEVTLDHRHEGAPGVAHGGVVAAALDDLFGGVLVLLEQPAVTANLSVDYRAPVVLGAPLELLGWSQGRAGRKLRLQGEMRQEGTLVAQATALFLAVDLEHFLRSGAPIPPEWHSWLSSSATG